jgi:hypothetical protein
MPEQRKTIFVLIVWGWRLILIGGFLYFLFWLLWQNMAASGYFLISKDFCHDLSLLSGARVSSVGKTDFFGNLYPINRVGNVEADERNRCFQTIFDEPVYFKVKMPRSFERVRAKIFYQNDNQSLLELGLMKDGQGAVDWQFQLKPLENQILDHLSWYKLTKGAVTLWQKKDDFKTIQQFVNNLPANKRVATFHYELAAEAIKNPQKVIDWNRQTPMQYVDYVIAQYQPPQRNGDLKIATADFLIAPEFALDHQLEFIISAPDLGKTQAELKIYKIELELQRGDIAKQNFQDILNTLIRRLRQKIG